MKLSDVDPVKCPHLYAALQRGLNAMHLEDAAEVKASSCWGSDSSRDSTKVCV